MIGVILGFIFCKFATFRINKNTASVPTHLTLEGFLVERRIWAEFDSLGLVGDRDRVIPDGICLDAEGAVWLASPGNPGGVMRVREGGAVAVPGAPDDPIQVIDVRDLTEWIIHLAEQNITGVFNGSGPDHVLTMGDVVEITKTATKSDVEFTWLGTGFMEAHPDVYFPIWTPYEGEYKGFHTFSNVGAIESGLKFRTLDDTIEALLKQFDERPEEERTAVTGNIPVAGEAEMIEAAKAAAGQ